LFWKLERVIFN
jgi:hypothetical protein